MGLSSRNDEAASITPAESLEASPTSGRDPLADATTRSADSWSELEMEVARARLAESSR